MSKQNENSESPEIRAPEWPPSEYREWVQSQIANKMLLKIGGISATSVLVLIGSLFAAKESVENSIKDKTISQVATELTADMRPIIESEVATTLFVQSKLIETLKKEITKPDSTIVQNILESDEFQRSLSNDLEDKLQKGGGLTRIILTEASQLASDDDASDASRALGVQLYTMFYDQASIDSDIEPLISQYATIVASSSETKPIPRRLLRAMMENLPSRVLEDANCAAIQSKCILWSRTVNEGVLNALEANGLDDVISEGVLDSYISSISAKLSFHMIRWAIKTEDLKLAENIFSSIIKSTNFENIDNLVEQIAKVSVDLDNPIRLVALKAISELDLDNNITQIGRENAINIIIEGMDEKTRKVSFDSEQLRARLIEANLQIEQRDENNRSFAANIENKSALQPPSDITDLGSIVSAIVENEYSYTDFNRYLDENLDPDDSYQIAISRSIQDALTSLLNIESDTSHEASNRGTDWQYFIEPLAERLPTSVGRSIWVLSLLEKKLNNENVSLAADVIVRSFLESKEWTTLSEDPLGTTALSMALLYSSDSMFKEFAMSFQENWATLSIDDSHGDILRSLIARDAASSVDTFEWTASSIAKLKTQRERDVLLDALLANLKETSAPKIVSTNREMERLSHAVSIGLDIAISQKSDYRLLNAILSELELRVETSYWDVVAALENSELLLKKNIDELNSRFLISSVLERFDDELKWIETTVDNAEILAINSIGKIDLYHFNHAVYGTPSVQLSLEKREGGYWKSFEVDGSYRLEFEEFTSGLELVIMDGARQNVIDRRRGNTTDPGDIAPLYLEQGVYAIAARSTQETNKNTSTEKDRRIAVSSSATPKPLSNNTRQTPETVDYSREYEFASTVSGSQLWFSIPLRAREIVKIQTLPPLNSNFGSNEETDTYISLIDSDGVEILDDDDGGSGNYSNLTYRNLNAGNYILHVTDLLNDSFPINSSFIIKFEFEEPAELVTANSRQSPVLIYEPSVFYSNGELPNGLWFEVTLEELEELLVEISYYGDQEVGDEKLVVSILDQEFRLLSQNSVDVSAPFYTSTTGGKYFVSVVGQSADTGIYPFDVSLDINAVPPILSETAKNQPVKVGREGHYRISAENQRTSDVWLEVDLFQGDRLQVESMPSNQGFEIDTVITLIEVQSEQAVDYNDDKDSSYFSKLVHDVDLDGKYFLKIEDIGSEEVGFTSDFDLKLIVD